MAIKWQASQVRRTERAPRQNKQRQNGPKVGHPGRIRDCFNPQNWLSRVQESPGLGSARSEADLAQAGALLRGITREGTEFPSLKKVYAEVFPNSQEFYVNNPLTGGARKYVPPLPRKPKFRGFVDENGRFVGEQAMEG